MNDSDQDSISASALRIPERNSSRSLAAVERDLLDAAGITGRVLFHSIRPSMGPVAHVCLSGDGALLAVASKSFVFLFESGTWKEAGVLQGHRDNVTCTCLCTREGILISGSLDGSLIFWDLGRLEQTMAIELGSPVISLHASPDYRKVVAGCNDGLIKIIDIESGNIRVIRDEGAVTEVFISGKWLTTETRTCVSVWEIDTNRLNRRYCFPIKGNDFTEMESLFSAKISVNERHRAVLVDFTTGCALQEFRHKRGEIHSVFMTENGGFLATAGEDKEVRLWGSKGDLLGVFTHSDAVKSVQISSDSRYLVTGSEDTTAAIWKLSGEKVRTIGGDIQGVMMVKLLPELNQLVVGGYKGVVVYSLETGQREYTFGPRDCWIGALSVDVSGKRMAASFRDGTVQIRNMEERCLVATLQQAGEKFYAVAISPDGKTCYAGTEEGGVYAWDLDAESMVGQASREFIRIHNGWVRSIAVSPDGKLIASGGWDGRVIIWEVGGNIKAECCSSSDGTYTVTFDSSGTLLAAGDRNGMVRVWDKNGKRQASIQTYQHQVKQVVFIDGNSLLTAGFDGTAKLWDINTGQCCRVFQGGHEHPWVRSVLMYPDGSRVVTAGKDGAVCFWRADDGELLAKLYQLDDGFLWTTPPEANASTGWFWTDREDMLVIQEKNGGDDAIAQVMKGSKRREYISTYNNRIKIVSRLTDSASHKEEQFKRMLGLKRSELREQYEPRRLTAQSANRD